ncbi:MAG: hypothetical protein H7240_05395 [Glaciimonas sp.]|nr:hypothetical protein [Glaciimonas sp.]
MQKFFEATSARTYTATLTKKIYDFVQERITIHLIISFFAIAATLLYVQRPHSFPLELRSMLWVFVIFSVLAAGLLLWNAITKRNGVSHLAKGLTKIQPGLWSLFSGVTALILTGTLLSNLAVPLVLVGIFGALGFYFPQPRREYLARLPVLATAILYAVTLALLVVYLRSASGFITPQEPLDPQASAIPLAYFAAESNFVYNKAHIKSEAIQFVFFSAAFLLLLLPAIAKFYPRRKFWLHSPFTPAAIFVALVATIPIPPFGMDSAHWGHWIGPARALLDGQWPYFDVFSYYGLLPIVALAGWIAVFEDSYISLAVFLATLAFSSATLVYSLIARHGRSHMAAFIGVSVLMLFAYDQKGMALPYPNHSALRFHFFISAVLWTAFAFFTAFKRGTKHAYIYAFLLGLLTTWGPSDGLFVFIGITLVLTVTAAKGNHFEKTKALFAYAAYIAGLSLLFVIALCARGTLSGVIAAPGRVIDFLSIFGQGYGNLPQYFDTSFLLALAMVFTLTAYCVRFFVLKRVMTPRVAFAIFSLILSAPYLLQAITRTPVLPAGFLWVLLPCFLILVASKPLRFSLHPAPALAIAPIAIVISVVFSLGNPVTKLAYRLEPIVAGQENSISLWAQRCADAKAKGAPCESVRPFTLAGLYAAEPRALSKSPIVSRITDECRKGTLIVDQSDALIYQSGNCRPHHPYQSFFSISTKKQADEYSQILSRSDSVFFGENGWNFQRRLSDQLKEKWLAQRRAPSTCDAAKANIGEFVASGLSDLTRGRGIGLSNDPNILLDIDRGILCHIRPGMRLKFSASGERIVRRVDGDVIQLIGLPLDPVADGYPNPIRIVQTK